MKNVFIFHGTLGHPKENWIPWIKEELVKMGYKVFIPKFPTPNNQTLESWLNTLENYKEKLNHETMIIGHSLGGAFLLRVLEKSKIKINIACIIAAPIGILPIKNYEGDKPFIEKPFNFEKIKKNANQFLIFHSDNDPYVCLANGEKLSKELKTNLNFISNAGHFNEAAGYIKFPELLEKIKEKLLQP